MRDDNIARIEVKEDGRLCIWPAKERFNLIYRSAMEVHWDQKENCLFGPKPREWSYLEWFKQIIAAAKDEYGVTLKITQSTLWINIDLDLRNSIEGYAGQ